MATLDMNANYSHPKFRGIALYIAGYAKRWEPETCFVTDDEGNEYEEPTGEGEWMPDHDSERVLVVMVGDDHKYEVEASDLTVISEDDFCDGCGQIGCGHGSRRET